MIRTDDIWLSEISKLENLCFLCSESWRQGQIGIKHKKQYLLNKDFKLILQYKLFQAWNTHW
jgi:hypothetical protein